ncbi:MAG: metallophosphoesterase [Clostridia bacterium]|nr:metallophosphoesterase [Clostridia bacterium]
MKTTVIRNVLALLSVICLLLCVAPIASVSATEAAETNVQLFIRPGRESNYAPLYLSAAESAPSGSNHSTHRYFPLAGEGSITIDGAPAPEHYAVQKYGTDGNGGKWILYSNNINAEELLEIGQTVTIRGKFSCSEDPSYVIEFAEVHFQRTGEKSWAQVETAGGGDEETPDTPSVSESGIKLTIRAGRATSEHLYLSASDSAACTTDYTTHFLPVDGKGAVYLDGAPLSGAYLIKYGAGKWVFRMPMDGVNRTMGAGETLTFKGQFQSTLDGAVVDFAEVSFRLVAKSGASYTWNEVSSAEHVKITLSDLGIENGDYNHVLTSANVNSLAGKELLFNVSHTYDSTAVDGEGGRIYIGGTAATPRSGVQMLLRKDSTLNIYAPDGSTRVLKTEFSTLGINYGDQMKWSVSLHYIDSDGDGAKDDAAVRLLINGQAVGESELVFPNVTLGNTVAFYENTGNTLSLSSVDVKNHVSLEDFGLSNGEYGATSTAIGISDISLRGTVFEVDMTRYADVEDDVENLVFFDYGTTMKGQWDGIRVAVRSTDGMVFVHNLLKGTTTYGHGLSSASLTSLGAAIGTKFRLSLYLEMVDKDSDGFKDDALLTVKINGNEIGAGQNYILDANFIGNGVLIYGTKGDSATLGQVDYVDPNKLVNPFTFGLSEKEVSGINANGDLELFLKPNIGILGNPNEAVYGGLTVTVGTTELTDLAFTKTDFGSFKVTVPAAKLPSGNFTVQIAAGELTRSDEGNVMTLRADNTLYVNAYGVSLSAYVECAGQNVSFTWASSQPNNQSGIYLTATDNMPVDSSWGTFIYPANEISSGVFINGTRAAVAVKKYGNTAYYLCLVDYGYAPKDGDMVLVSGRYELGNMFVEFAPIMFKWNAAAAAWSQVDLSASATLPPMIADVTGGPLVLDNVVSINGAAVNAASSALGTVGDNTVVYRYGTLEISQQVSLYRAGDVDTDGEYTVADAVRMLVNNANDSDASRLAMQSGNLSNIRSRILGETIADKRLPTSTIGQTSANKFITSVTSTNGGTTVFGMADTANGYVSAGDFDAFGFDYVIDLNADRDFKILQLSDTQIIDSAQQRDPDRLGASGTEFWAPEKMDERVLDQIRYLIQTNKPDLVIISGDTVYGEFDDAGTSFQALINCLEEQKVLWAPVYGNHDNESTKGVVWQSTLLENTDYCLFKRRHEIDGNGNYSIGIAQNGELQRTIYMMDSNGCGATSDPEVTKRVGMSNNQIAWYRALALNANTVSGKTIPSFIVCHIPPVQFHEAAQAACYQGATDSSSVTYTIGVDNVAQPGDFGTKGEQFKSAWTMKGLHEIMLEVGTDGMFVGHSHMNNTSVYYGGVRWTYALKTGQYDRYPTHQGGLTIELDGDDFALQQVFAN